MILNLKAIGLSEDEAYVYGALLKKNLSTATELSKITNINRTKLYSIMSSLIKRGLCNEILGSVKKYEIIDPQDAFNKMITEQKQLLDNLKKMPQTILPIYKSNKGKNSPLEYVQVHTTKNSIINRYSSLELASVDSIQAFCKPPYTVKDPALTDAQLKNMKAGVIYKSIYQVESDNLESFISSVNGFERFGEQVKISYDLPIKMHIFDGSIVFFALINQVNLQQIDTYITIEHPDIAQTLQYVFDLYWDSSLSVSEFINITKK